MASMESLTNEQLCALAQVGDELAKSTLIEKNKPFIQRTAEQFAENPLRKEPFSLCGIDTDDLVQAGSIGLWKVIDSYDFSRENNFLTYAAPAIRHAMSDMIRQYSQNTVWQLRQDKANTWNIVHMDEPLDDLGEDTAESLIALPNAKLPEQICIERETAAELREAMNALSDRENVYVRYRYGFTDGETHPLTETAQYFRLTVSRTKSVERSALRQLKHELLVEIPERASARAEDRQTKLLVAAGELHAVKLRLKSQKKRGRKITAAVYEYLADCDGKWGRLNYNFKDDTAEILMLAEWDTVLNHQFAMRVVGYLREHRTAKLPEKFILTFIGPEQINARIANCHWNKESS